MGSSILLTVGSQFLFLAEVPSGRDRTPVCLPYAGTDDPFLSNTWLDPVVSEEGRERKTPDFITTDVLSDLSENRFDSR